MAAPCVDAGRIQALLDVIAVETSYDCDRGIVANYIPALASVSPDHFGIAVALAGGRVLSAGDTECRFSLQSISKVFTLAIALGRSGNRLWQRVGREASGSSFNSIIQLEQDGGIPRNPFINPGAIVTTDEILSGREPKQALAELLDFVRNAAGDFGIHIVAEVAAGEAEHGHRNFALAHFLKASGNLANPVDLVLGTYFHQCAMEMSVQQLALAGRFLVDSPGFPRLVAHDRRRSIAALMLTCGLYKGSGDFANRVGLPAKSGVGGGVLAIMPGIAAIAAWAPGLDINGNSILAVKAVERLATEMRWSVY